MLSNTDGLLLQRIHMPIYFLNWHCDLAGDSCDLCQHHSPYSTNYTHISLRDGQSNCSTLSRELAQNLGWTHQASPQESESWVEWKKTENGQSSSVPQMSSSDLPWFPRGRPLASPQFSATSQSPRFFFYLSYWPGLATAACQQRALIATALQRDWLKYVLTNFCFY